MHYWDGNPAENVFMEITRRDDIGGDLEAPLLSRVGGATGSYVLVPLVQTNDVVVHYDSASEQIVGASVVAANPEPTTTWWAPRGVTARRAGVEPQWLPGIRVPLAHFVASSPPITMVELREREAELMHIHAELRTVHGPRASLYYPWVPYAGGSKPMRTYQTYLAKLPQRAVDVFPSLRSAVDATSAARVGPIGAAPETERAVAAVEDTAGRSSRRRGQGFALDQQIKVAVEARAMNEARKYFQCQATVHDVHGHESYDLRCIAAEGEFHVEVKGTTTAGEAVLLTPNEVQHARDGTRVVLFVLSKIAIERTASGRVTAHGGVPLLLDPWMIDDGDLEPLGYRYKLPPHVGSTRRP